LVSELKRLNDLLERKVPKAKETSALVASIAKHADHFAQDYFKVVAKGAGGLTIAALATLLFHAGVPESVLGGIWSVIIGKK
jgi:hypothetical protein